MIMEDFKREGWRGGRNGKEEGGDGEEKDETESVGGGEVGKEKIRGRCKEAEEWGGQSGREEKQGRMGERQAERKREIAYPVTVIQTKIWQHVVINQHPIPKRHSFRYHKVRMKSLAY